MYRVGVSARYQFSPKGSQLSAPKRILPYVKGTTRYGIWDGLDNGLILAGYCDVD